MDMYHSPRREPSIWIKFCSRVAAIAAPKNSPVPSGMPYTRLNMEGTNTKMEENMPQSNATMKRSLMVMVAAGTSSLASAMGISTSTLASSTTIVGNVPTSVTALEITARDATANQAAVEKAALVGSAFLDR